MNTAAPAPASGPTAALDRVLVMELVRVTEGAALGAGRWMGRGDKIGGDAAAVNAMRAVLNEVGMDGVVVIGEGEKDEAPMLFNGEKLGTGVPPEVDIAVDPIDGTRLLSTGGGGAIAVVALAERGKMFRPTTFYMDKIVVGPDCVGVIDIEAPRPPISGPWRGQRAYRSRYRASGPPRHAELIKKCGRPARIKLIMDDDVAGSLRRQFPNRASIF
jgi:fructose-1,6-bisphosphatase II